MRILICYPWLDLGGASNTAITVAKGVKERGHDVVFFTKTGGMYEERLKKLDIPVISAPSHKFLPLMYHLNLKAYRLFCDTLDRYSIDLIHTFHYNHYYLSLFAAAKRDIPVVFSAVWYMQETPFPEYPGRVTFVAREFLDKARNTIGKHSREMTVLPNRIDLGMFHPDIDHTDFSRRFDLPDSGWKIVFMSRVDSLKFGSLSHAIEAIRLVALKGNRVTLVIAGDGSYFGDLKFRAEKVNEEIGHEVIKLIGAVLETPELLSWADIVFGIGRCAWEGMACGKPVFVVGENGFAGMAAPENVDELQYYNFAGRNIREPVDPGLLADRVEKIMGSEETYNKLAQFSTKYVMENYDYRAGAVKFEQIYEKAINDPPLNMYERVRLYFSNFIYGYCRQVYLAWRVKLRGYIGRGRNDDKIIH